MSIAPKKTRGPRKANYGAGNGRHARGREISPALLYVLNHPIRRQILRLLHKQPAPRSPSEMSKLLAVSLTNVGFHARTLCECGVVREAKTCHARGSVEHFYASRVTGNELVAAILRGTEEDDRFLCR
jgi:DNA-binding transcriptional ArsR family regulator